MGTRNPEKLSKLLKQNARSKRASEMITRWATHGVLVSAVAHDRHWKLIDKLRGGRSWSLQHVHDLSAEVQTFVGVTDVVTILGWDVEYEPALLLSSEALLRTMPNMEKIYPDGFVLINDRAHTALLVDIDEDEGVHANRIDLQA